MNFDCISCHFRFQPATCFIFSHKMASGGHFGWPKITFDRISRHFWSIRNFYAIHNFNFFWICSQNGCRWPFWMTENYFQPKITFDRISPNFRSIRNFFFHKIAAAAILDDRKSLFLAISDQYATLIFFLNFTKWLPVAILDDRKSLSNAFLTISDQ